MQINDLVMYVVFATVITFGVRWYLYQSKELKKHPDAK